MRRLLSAVVLVAGSALALLGCPEQNVDPTKFPDAWWLPGEDAGRSDAGLVPADAAAAAWVSVSAPNGGASFRLNAVAANGSSMLAVGNDGTAFGFDPLNRWTNQPTHVTAHLNAVASLSSTDWWIAGAAKTVLRFDGTDFTPEQLPGATSPDLKAVAASSTQVFAAGAGGARFLYDVGAASWTDQVPGAAVTADITGLWYSGKAFYEVDSGGGVSVFEAAGWRNLTTLSGKLLAIWGTSDTDYWMVGEQIVCHNDGAFETLTPPDAATWNAVWGPGNGSKDVWIGSKEHGLLKWNGNAWERVAGFDLTGKDLFGLGGATGPGTWSVGDNVLQQLL